jgi:hypothetical protein
MSLPDKCSHGKRWLGERGKKVTATFTVKEHTSYQGTAQTVLARPVFPKAEAVPAGTN